MVGTIDLDFLLFGLRVGQYVNAEPSRHETARLDRNEKLRSKRQFAIHPRSTRNGEPPMGC
jgi:hypothetical protein